MGERLDTIKDVMRCRAMVARVLAGMGDDAELDAAVAAVHGLPEHAPNRGALAASLLSVLVGRMGSDLRGPRHVDDLLTIADADPPDTPQWPRIRSCARVLSIQSAMYENRSLPDFDAALAELSAIATAAGDDLAVRYLAGTTRVALTFARAVREGDETTAGRMPAEVAKLGELAAGHPDAARLTELISQGFELFGAHQRDDPAEQLRSFDRLSELVSRLPADHFMHSVVAETETMVGPLRGLLDGSGDGATTAVTDTQLAGLAAFAKDPDATVSGRVMRHLAVAMAALGGGDESDPDRIDVGIEHSRSAVALAAFDDPQRPFYLASLALCLNRRNEVTGDLAALYEAADLLERARGLLSGPQHPHWLFVNEMLSTIRQRCAQYPQASRSGLDGLRSHVWRVLLQSDRAGARISIRGAAGDAIDVARRCLAENNVAAALQALDTGRGLLLFAATEHRNIAARLVRAGEPELARRWQEESRTAGGAPSGLRRDVLTALVRQAGATGGLLDPPGLPEIRSALVRLDADALVYLVPGEPPLPGLVVIAPVDGPPSYLARPDLTVGEDVEVERYLAALADRSRDFAGTADRDRFAGRVDALCDWAWRVAIGPLLERYVAARPAPPGGRPPRLVLIPMGDLARVPWQAARRGDGTYAIELAAFSQAVSARLLCDCASRAPVPLGPTGLVVGDPDTGDRNASLEAARREAYAIRQAFYRGARYVGRRPDGSVSPSGAGTADQVRQWLARSDPAAGAMLHLACHGSFTADSDDAKSYLALAAGPPQQPGAGEFDAGKLDADELTDALTRARHRDLGLVVLAACNSGRSVHGYDEAYSLGTAFLAAGARSVLSTQWRVPDLATSALMFMFHHHLRHDGLPPWRALREAQRWMIDPHRQPPSHMPAELRPRPSGAGHADVVAWAGFVHWGQ